MYVYISVSNVIKFYFCVALLNVCERRGGVFFCLVLRIKEYNFDTNDCK
jgi:hypothetical protein